MRPRILVPAPRCTHTVPACIGGALVPSTRNLRAAVPHCHAPLACDPCLCPGPSRPGNDTTETVPSLGPCKGSVGRQAELGATRQLGAGLPANLAGTLISAANSPPRPAGHRCPDFCLLTHQAVLRAEAWLCTLGSFLAVPSGHHIGCQVSRIQGQLHPSLLCQPVRTRPAPFLLCHFLLLRHTALLLL